MSYKEIFMSFLLKEYIAYNYKVIFEMQTKTS